MRGKQVVATVLAGGLVAGTMASAAVAQTPIPNRQIRVEGTPRSIAIDDSGTLYIADSDGTTVEVVDPGEKKPNPSKAFTGLKRPHGVALDGQGNLYVADTMNSVVKVFSIAGSHSTPVRTLTGVTNPFGVGVNSKGTVYASNGLMDTVAVYDPNTTTPNSSPLTGVSHGGSVAVDKNDNVYVSDAGNGIRVFDSGSTTPDPSQNKTGLNDPQGMAFNSLGQLYVADQLQSKVFVYNPNKNLPDDNLSLTGIFGDTGVAIAKDDSVHVGGLINVADYAVYTFAPPAPPVPPTFECTGAPQLYNVPTWTNQLQVTLKGAQGGGAAGGNGAVAAGTLAVTPGSQIQVNVGCRGGDSNSGKGGFNGGGNAGAAGASKGKHLGAFTGGGGATDLRVGDCATTQNCGLNDRIFVAGGGGGGEVRKTDNCYGGNGGLVRESGAKDSATGVGRPGGGATATAGGAGGGTATGSGGKKGDAGAAGVGGSGGDSNKSTQSGPGAGGGGGLFGGGGGGGGGSGSIDLELGAGVGGAGGGGSSGVPARGAGIVSGASYATGLGAGNGSVTITPAAAPLSISTVSLADGAPTVEYEQQLRAKGGVPGYTWSLDGGALPAGLSLLPGGEISGIPTTAGTSNFTVKVTDQIGNTATKPLSILIDTGIVITTPSLPIGSVGVAYSKALSAVGGGGATGWQIDDGSRPPGLSLDASTGVISGTPTAAGEYHIVVEVTAADASTVLAPFFLDISPPLAISSSSLLPKATVGTDYATDLNANGGESPYAWTVTSGSLPAGLSLAAGTGTITGKPASAGTKTFTVSTTDYLGTSVSKQFTITVAPANVCKLAVKARSAAKKLPRRGTTTVVKRASVAKKCILKIKVIASKGTRGDVRLVDTSINHTTGKARVQTLGIPGVKVKVKITGVVKKKPKQKSTWNRTWATK